MNTILRLLALPCVLMIKIVSYGGGVDSGGGGDGSGGGKHIDNSHEEAKFSVDMVLFGGR